MRCISQVVLLIVVFCFYEDKTVLSLFLLMYFFVNVIINKTNKILLVLMVVIGICYLFFIGYINQNSSFNFLYQWVNNLLTIDLRNKIYDFFIALHGNKIGSFLSLILLNIKNETSYSIYYALINLSIVHLIVISGFHVNLICCLIIKLFHKLPKIGRIIALLVAFLIAYLNGFSASTVRVLFSTFFYSFKKTKKYSVDFSILIIALIAPKLITSFSLCMTYLGYRGIKIFYNFSEKNKLFNDIFSSLFATLYLLPFIAIMNNGISLWGVFFSFLFSPIFMLFYFFAILFSWFNCFDIIFNFAYELLFQSSDLLTNINVFISFSFLTNDWFIGVYYSFFELLNLIFKNKGGNQKWRFQKFEKI